MNELKYPVTEFLLNTYKWISSFAKTSSASAGNGGETWFYDVLGKFLYPIQEVTNRYYECNLL